MDTEYNWKHEDHGSYETWICEGKAFSSLEVTLVAYDEAPTGQLIKHVVPASRWDPDFEVIHSEVYESSGAARAALEERDRAAAGENPG
jgi:hypothetical protein